MRPKNWPKLEKKPLSFRARMRRLNKENKTAEFGFALIVGDEDDVAIVKSLLALSEKHISDFDSVEEIAVSPEWPDEIDMTT